MIKKSTTTKALMIISFILLCLLLTGFSQNYYNKPNYIVKGPVNVSYQIQITPTSATGTSTPREFSEILMFDRYVILKSKDGSSKMFPVDKMNKFSWAPVK